MTPDIYDTTYAQQQVRALISEMRSQLRGSGLDTNEPDSYYFNVAAGICDDLARGSDLAQEVDGLQATLEVPQREAQIYYAAATSHMCP